jgi:hypothetical protein
MFEVASVNTQRDAVSDPVDWTTLAVAGPERSPTQNACIVLDFWLRGA